MYEIFRANPRARLYGVREVGGEVICGRVLTYEHATLIASALNGAAERAPAPRKSVEDRHTLTADDIATGLVYLLYTDRLELTGQEYKQHILDALRSVERAAFERAANILETKAVVGTIEGTRLIDDDGADVDLHRRTYAAAIRALIATEPTPQ